MKPSFAPRASLGAQCERALGENSLEIIVSALACECSYDADVERVSQRLAQLESSIVAPALHASTSAASRVVQRIFHPTTGTLRYFEGVELSNEGSTSRALVLETRDAYYYSFGGTQTTRDLISDANYWLTPLPTTAGENTTEVSGIRVHRGFLVRAESVAIATMYEKARRAGKRLVMCGHSLGGATAALATIMFLARGPEAACRKHVRCVTFASPPVGNAALSRLIKDQDWCSVFTNICAPEDRISKLLLSRPGYVHFISPKLIQEDGQITNSRNEKIADEDPDSGAQKSQKDASASIMQPRSVVYIHAMKTYRERLLRTLMSTVPSVKPESFSGQMPRPIPVITRLGPSPSLNRAIGVLSRDGTSVTVLVRGNDIDSLTCSRTRAEVKGWPCGTTSRVLSNEALMVSVASPVLHGAPLPSDKICSPTEHGTWMPLVVGAGGDFSMDFVNVLVVPRNVVLIRTSNDAAFDDSKAYLIRKFPAVSINELNVKRNVLDGYMERLKGSVCIHQGEGEGEIVVRVGGKRGKGKCEVIQKSDARALEKLIRSALLASEVDALESAFATPIRARM